MTRTSLVLAAALLAGCGLGGPAQPIFTATGRVVDGQGSAVAGAVVTDGQASALTDENGRYTFAIFAKTLTIVKPGYARGHLEAEKGTPTVSHLSTASSQPRVGMDTRWGATGLAGLRTALGTVADYPATSLDDLDVLFMITPEGLDAQERSALEGWVRDGGRLLLAGEWGGYPAESLDTLNELANPAGITFTGGTVKTDGQSGELGWNSTCAITPPSLAKLASGSKDNQVYLFSAGTLALSPPARTILQSASDAYGVLGVDPREGTQILAGVGAAGEGKVFAVADSSLWRDEASDGGKQPNVARGANARLAAAVLGW